MPEKHTQGPVAERIARIGDLFAVSGNFLYGEEELSHRAVTVYVYLRDRSNKEGSCWPGVKTIARELKLSPRTVQRAVRDLEKVGLVTRQARYRENGSYTSNKYFRHKRV